MRTLRIGPACLDYCGSEPATLLESIHRIGLVVKKANDIVVAVDLYIGEPVTRCGILKAYLGGVVWHKYPVSCLLASLTPSCL